MTSPRVVVVGGGISGLAAAWRLRLLRPDAEITVLEAAARWGGKLVTEVRDGFLVEGAAGCEPDDEERQRDQHEQCRHQSDNATQRVAEHQLTHPCTTLEHAHVSRYTRNQ